MAGYIGNYPTAVPLTGADLTDGIITSAKIADGTIALADLSTTGTASASTFLRGDNSWQSAGGGKVLQVLTATDSTSRSTTSTSFVTASNTLTINITPSATSSKILLISGLSTESNSNVIYLTIYRDGTNLNTTNNSGLGTAGGGIDYDQAGIVYLDSPNTTSQVTYQFYFRANTGTILLNSLSSRSSLIAMEIGS